MLIRFDTIQELTIPCLNGGEGAVSARMLMWKDGKVMLSRLPVGSSIGEHSHSGSSEIDYVLAGTGHAFCDGMEEALQPGLCHVCPDGSCHSIVNDGKEELVLLTIVPEKK